MKKAFNIEKIENRAEWVHVSRGMSGKMAGILAISTSVIENAVCQARAKIKGSVCEKCFALSTVKRYGALAAHLALNLERLAGADLTPAQVPYINGTLCRFEAFGDLANVTHAKNYIRIAAANPHCTFALWTKNPGFLKKAIDELGKPANLIVVLSSFHLNKIDSAAAFPFVDHVFTVYDAETIERENVEINCGARDCMGCRRCYTVGNADFYISEKLK